MSKLDTAVRTQLGTSFANDRLCESNLEVVGTVEVGDLSLHPTQIAGAVGEGSVAERSASDARASVHESMLETPASCHARM